MAAAGAAPTAARHRTTGGGLRRRRGRPGDCDRGDRRAARCTREPAGSVHHTPVGGRDRACRLRRGLRNRVAVRPGRRLVRGRGLAGRTVDRVPAFREGSRRDLRVGHRRHRGEASDRTSRAARLRLRLVRPHMVAGRHTDRVLRHQRRGKAGDLRAGSSDRHRAPTDARDRHLIRDDARMVAGRHTDRVRTGGRPSHPRRQRCHHRQRPAARRRAGPGRDRGRRCDRADMVARRTTRVHGRGQRRDGAVRHEPRRDGSPPPDGRHRGRGGGVVAGRHAASRSSEATRSPSSRWRAARSAPWARAATPPGVRTAPRSTPGRPGSPDPRCREARSPGGAGLRP